MATNLTSTTFLSEYNDDYRDSDHFHRILFNSGRALQARELTQSQTIIQRELSRLARFIVNEGSIFNNSASLSSGVNAFSYTYIKVSSLPTGYATLRGTEINNNDLYATVVEVLPASGSDPATLFVKMTKGSGGTPGTDTTVTKTFAPGAVLNTDAALALSPSTLTILSTSDAVGKASIVETPQFETLAGDHLIMVERQLLVLNKYSPLFTGVIGFKVTEDIVTTSDNIALYDNSGATPNLTSPGADRLRILLTLTTQANVTSSDTFFEVYKVVDGMVSLIKTPDKILSRIGKIIDARTYSQTGDFIEQRARGEFDLTINNDSADAGYLSFRVSGGTAFVNGSRIEKDFNLPIRVRKPRNTTTDVITFNNERAAANIGNYFYADTLYGLAGYVEDFTIVNLYTAINRGGINIGTARIKGLYHSQPDYKIHVLDVDITNADYGVGDVRSIGIDAQNYANLKALQNRYDVYNKYNNKSFFTLPNTRVQEISSVTGVISKVYTVNKSAATVVINAGTDTFTETDDWIYQVDGSGVLYHDSANGVLNVTLSGSSNEQATISNVPNGAGHVLAYQNTTLTRKNKSLKPSTADNDWESESVSLSGDEFTLSKADIFRFYSVTDDTTSEDITYKFIFDNGQRDTFYGPGKGRLRAGKTAPTGTVTVKYKYFQHDTPSGVGYFGGAASYSDVSYNQIPIYTDATGVSHHLADVIDMRSLKNPADETFSGGIARIEDLPKNQSTLTIGTAKYWKPRRDIISLSSDGVLRYHAGPSSLSLPPPDGVDNLDMKLYNIVLNPFTFNERDLTVTKYDNRGFKMADIRAIESRLSNVERITSLTLAEQSLASLQVYDPTDATFIRQTEGITGDNFSSSLQSALYDDDYRAGLDEVRQHVIPFYINNSIGVTYDSDLSLDTCVIKGNNIWPAYTEVVSTFGQTKATGIIPVNQFDIPQSVGTALLVPEGDYWTKKRLVDKSFVSQSNSSLLPEGTVEISTVGEVVISTGAYSK